MDLTTQQQQPIVRPEDPEQRARAGVPARPHDAFRADYIWHPSSAVAGKGWNPIRGSINSHLDLLTRE